MIESNHPVYWIYTYDVYYYLLLLDYIDSYQYRVTVIYSLV